MDNTNDKERPGNTENDGGCPGGVPAQTSLAVGDYVEWHPAPKTHVKGEIVEIHGNVALVCIDWDFVHPGPTSWQGTTQFIRLVVLRRISRLSTPACVSCGAVGPALESDGNGWRCAGCRGVRATHIPMTENVLKERHREPDPLEVEYDGVTLRDLLAKDAAHRQDLPSNFIRLPLTPAQRAAVSMYWSAQLRAKIADSAERERNRVVVDLQDEL